LDASGGSVFLNLLGAAKGALIRAAASTQSFSSFALGIMTDVSGTIGLSWRELY